MNSSSASALTNRWIHHEFLDRGVAGQLFYDRVGNVRGSRAEAEVLEALEEHRSVKVSLHELELLDATGERLDAEMNVLIEHVRHHVTEEEQQLFPQVRHALGRPRLLVLSAEFRDARRRVPTRRIWAAPTNRWPTP